MTKEELKESRLYGLFVFAASPTSSHVFHCRVLAEGEQVSLVSCGHGNFTHVQNDLLFTSLKAAEGVYIGKVN